MNTMELLTLVGIFVALVVGVGSWFFLRARKTKVQKQTVIGGIGIQSGRDSNIKK